MGLELKTIAEKLLNKKKNAIITRAKAHQNRVKFHTEPRITANLGQPVTEFLSWVSMLLPRDKFFQFKTLLTFPVKSQEVTKTIFDKLSRVFDGRNPAFNYQFMNTEQRDDWEYYRQNILDEPKIWKTKGWEHFKTEFNSVLVVDMPRAEDQDATDKYPQPYFYFLTLDNIIDFEVNSKTGNMDYIIAKQSKDKVLVIDDEHYRIIEYKGGKLGAVELEQPHDLGYCPARFFWGQPLLLSEPYVKASPISAVLASLDWFLYYATGKKSLDIYGAYPIYTGYEMNCDYKDTQTEQYCDGGFIRNAANDYIIDPKTAMLCRCPVCGDKRFAGAGTFIEVPIPTKEQADLSKPIDIVSIDATSLEYNVREQERLKVEVINTAVGNETPSTNDKAINEKQVTAGFESLTTVLSNIKLGFEEAQTFVDETVCRLRYGSAFISADVNLGTDFYVSDPNMLREKYKMAKEAGASEADLDAISKQLLENEYRSNPQELQRMLILSELEPFQHFTRVEVMDLKDKGLATDEQLIIKLNFNSFVRRFERENINILEFGAAIPFDRKIEVITNKFKEYASDYITRPNEAS